MTDTLPAETKPINSALSILGGSDDDFKDMRARDHVMPRLNIMQALSQDVVDGRFPAGTVVDSSTKAAVLTPRTEGKFVVPLMMWLEWIEWNRSRSVQKDERIIERSVDPTSKLAKRAEAWETYKNNDGRDVCAVTEYYNFICALVDPKRNTYDDTYIMGFARSSHKTGKLWLNRMYKTRIEVDGEYIRPPMFAMRWAYKTEMEKKNGYSFFIPVIGDGQPNPQADWAMLRAMSDGLKARRAEIMDRNSNKDADETEEGAAAGANTAAGMASEV